MRRLQAGAGVFGGCDAAINAQGSGANVEEWFGHADIATPRIYDRRQTLPETDPTFQVSY